MFKNLTTSPAARKIAHLHEVANERKRSVRGVPGADSHVVDWSSTLEAALTLVLENRANPDAVIASLFQVQKFWIERVPHADIKDEEHPWAHQYVDKLGAVWFGGGPLRDEYRGLVPDWRVESYVNVVNMFMQDAQEQNVDPVRFLIWSRRFADWYRVTGDLPSKFIWQNECDLTPMSLFASSRWDRSRQEVIRLIMEEGHDPALVKKYGVFVCKMLNAQQLGELAHANVPANTLKTLCGMDTHGRQELTADRLLRMVAVGFVNATEVKDYARTFTIPFTDERFYDRVCAAKSHYPVLADYQPQF